MSMTLSGESIRACMSWVSLAVDRFLILDLLPERALRISALLLMLLEEGRREAFPFTLGVLEIRIELTAGNNIYLSNFFFRNETIYFCI